MAQKRPSYVSLRTRKVKLLKYIGTTGKTEAQAARDFGVDTEQLRRFITQDPKSARRTYNRSPQQRRLYEEIGAQSTRPRYRAGARIEKVRGTRLIQFDARPAVLDQIRKTPGLSEVERSRRLQIGELIRAQYLGEPTPESAWALYARENGIPTSINAIKTLFHNDVVSTSKYARILNVWKQIYSISDAYYERYAEEVGEEEAEG